MMPIDQRGVACSQSALRQAVYLAIKELATTAEDVIMVTSSIMKDMQANSDVIYRPNAIRALCRIIDVCTHRLLYLFAYSDYGIAYNV